MLQFPAYGRVRHHPKDDMALTDPARQLLSKVEVLKDLETKVRELMSVH